MKNILTICSFVLSVFTGCDDNFLLIDITPPSSPKGLYAVAKDEQVELSWIANSENDLSGYNIYAGNFVNGPFQFLKSTKKNHYADPGIQNGKTYYYRISAYDRDGNESSLTHDLVYAIPRPEGYDMVLTNFRSNPNLSGFDFSTYSAGPYDDKYSDIFYEFTGGAAYMDVWDDSEIQDMGYTQSLDDIGQSPVTGWSPSRDVRLIIGHTYVIRTWDTHFAKIRVLSISSANVIFDWAYQLQTDNTLLKSNNLAARTDHNMGSGVKGRK